MSGFALLHWSLETATSTVEPSFGTYLYFSGTTFFTLGYGDVVPTGWIGRTLSVAEAGLGFLFLAVIVCYLPVLYQAFSRREITISLLDARAGSPPSASELLRRLADGHGASCIGPFLHRVEALGSRTAGESRLVPGVSYYRSQHENESWVSTLMFILDTSAC